MLTAKIKPVQFIVISKPVNDRNKIFFEDFNIYKKSLIFPVAIIIIDKKTNDQRPRWNAISIAGTNLISLKNNGWGNPQNIDAKTV